MDTSTQKPTDEKSQQSGLNLKSSWSGRTVSEILVQQSRQHAFEIEIQTLKEYQNYKNIFFNKDMEVLKEQYAKKYKQEETKRVIQRSRAIERSRFSKMELRNRCALKIFCDVQANLYHNVVLNQTKYAAFLQDYILQGLLKLMEQKVFIRCLQRDIPLINSIIPDIVKTFKLQLKEWYLVDVDPIILVDINNKMKERQILDFTQTKVMNVIIEDAEKQQIQQSEEDSTCFGGVILASNSGQIICQCTLDIRALEIFKKSLPFLRATLFPSSQTQELSKSVSSSPSKNK